MTGRLSGDTVIGTEPWRMSAVELAAAIRIRELSSCEVIDAHLRRIETVDPHLNAVTVTLAEESLETARKADDAAARGCELPPLHGVPFTVKENIDLMGVPTTQGLAALSEVYPTRDAPIVERMRSAGAIPIAHTNCPTIAVRWHTDSELWGATLNPWDRSRTPGGSSGGEAAALATGMTPLGLGNDGLGSLRWPAQCCGVAALKPTTGRIPHASSIEPEDPPIGVQLTVVEGPMARSVADLRAALDVLSGPTWRDPWSVPPPRRGLNPVKPIRVAVVSAPGGRASSAHVGEGIAKAAAALADAGYEPEEAEPPSIDEAAHLLLDMLNTPDIRAMWQARAPILPTDTQRFLDAFYEVAGHPDPIVVMQSLAARASLTRAWGEFLETAPLILTPISTSVPFEAGTDLDEGSVGRALEDMRAALAVNALGLPAVAVPVGVAQGLPQVVQLIGGRYCEDLCLDAAAAIEERIGVFTPIDPSW